MAKKGAEHPPRHRALRKIETEGTDLLTSPGKKREKAPLDVAKLEQDINTGKLDLIGELAGLGITLEELPHVMEDINNRRTAIVELSKKYEGVSDAREKRELEKQLRGLVRSFDKATARALGSAKELSKSRSESVTPTATPPSGREQSLGETGAFVGPPRPAPTTGAPELAEIFRTVPPRVAEKYATLKTKRERESFLKNSKIAQQTQAERENERKGKRPTGAAKAPEPFVGPPRPENIPPAPSRREGVDMYTLARESTEAALRAHPRTTTARPEETSEAGPDLEGELKKIVFGEEAPAAKPAAPQTPEESVPRISPEAAQAEEAEASLIDKNIEARRVAEAETAPLRENGFPNFLEALKRSYAPKDIPPAVLEQFTDYAEKLDDQVKSGGHPVAAEESMKSFLLGLGLQPKDLQEAARNLPKTRSAEGSPRTSGAEKPSSSSTSPAKTNGTSQNGQAEIAGRSEDQRQLNRLRQSLNNSFPNGDIPEAIKEESKKIERDIVANYKSNRKDEFVTKVTDFIEKLPPPPITAKEPPVEEIKTEPPIVVPGGGPDVPAEDSENGNIIPDPDNAADQEHVQEVIAGAQEEGTPKEWTARLKGLIESAKGKLYETGAATKEMFRNPGTYLAERAKGLDAKLSALHLEEHAKKIGDAYNKLPLWKKIALGTALTTGYGFTLPLSGVMGGAAALYGVSLIGTRLAAMAGSFRQQQEMLERIHRGEGRGRLENSTFYKWLASGSTETSRKNVAMAKALLSSFGMTAGMALTARELAEHHVSERIGQWISEHLPGKKADLGIREIQPPSAIPESSVQQNVPAAAVPEQAPTAPEAPQIEVPQLAVEVAPGKGYEWMAGQTWEQLQNKGITAQPGSDLEALLKADKDTINKVVHDLAEKHGFFKPDVTGGTSVQINLGDKMIINDEGSLAIVRGDQVFVDAPEGGHMTSAYQPQPAEVRPPPPEIREMINQATAEQEALQAEPKAVTSPEPLALPQENLAKGPYGVPIEQAPAPVEEARLATPEVPDNVWRDSQGNPITTEDGKPVIAGFEPSAPTPADLERVEVKPQEPLAHAEASQAPAVAPPETIAASPQPEAQTLFTSMDHAHINPDVPAIYEARMPDGSTYLTAYGGTDEQRFKFIQEYQEKIAKTGVEPKPIRFAHLVPTISGDVLRVEDIGAKQEEGGVLKSLVRVFKEQPKPPLPSTFLRKISP